MCRNNPAQFSAKIKTEGKEERWGKGEHSDAESGKQTTRLNSAHSGWWRARWVRDL